MIKLAEEKLNFKDFSILGVSLGADMRDLVDILREPSEIAKPAEGLEVWAWRRDHLAPLWAPIHVHWVNGEVSEVSGSGLTYKRESFDHSTSLVEIRNCIPGLNYTDRLHQKLQRRDENFCVSILVIPERNHFLLSCCKRGRLWAEMLSQYNS